MLKLGRHRGRKQYRQRAMNEPVGRSLVEGWSVYKRWWELRQDSQPEALTHKGPCLSSVRLDFYPKGCGKPCEGLDL